MIEGGWLFLLWSLSLKLVHGCEVIPDRVLMINRGELFISSNALIFEEAEFHLLWSWFMEIDGLDY